VAHCDWCSSTEGRLRVPVTELGVAPEAASSYLLPLRMGWQAAAHVLLTSEWIDAATAVGCGLAWKACAAGTVLDETMAVARKIAAFPLASLVATKKAMIDAHRDAVRAAVAREGAAFAALLGGAANTDALDAFARRRGAGTDRPAGAAGQRSASSAMPASVVTVPVAGRRNAPEEEAGRVAAWPSHPLGRTVTSHRRARAPPARTPTVEAVERPCPGASAGTPRGPTTHRCRETGGRRPPAASLPGTAQRRDLEANVSRSGAESARSPSPPAPGGGRRPRCRSGCSRHVAASGPRPKQAR